jgi:hypothetical protein
MKTTLVKLLLDARGRLVSVVTGAFVAFTTRLLTAGKIEIDPEIEMLVSTIAGLLAMWIFDSIIIKLQTDGVKRIQDALPSNVPSDGVPGDVTVAAVKRAVADHQDP